VIKVNSKHTVYVKSFEWENFRSSSLKLNMYGKLLQLRTLCFATNPKTIHTRDSSVYGVLKLEESCFTCMLWQKKQENSAIFLSKADIS